MPCINPKERKRKASVLNRKRYQRIKKEDWYLKQKHQWYLSKAKKISEENKKKRIEYRILHPIVRKTEEEKKARIKAWREKNKNNLNAKSLKRRDKNLEKYQQYARGYYREGLSYKVQYGRLRYSSKERKIVVLLSLNKFTEIVSRPCIYCGESKERRGIDRIDNSIGYTKENSAPCCKICNYMKKTMTVSNFLAHVKKIY